MADAQDQSLVLGKIVPTPVQSEAKPQILMLPASDGAGYPAATLIAAGLASEGWTASGLVSNNLRHSEPTSELSSIRLALVERFESFRCLVRRVSSCDIVHISCTSTRQVMREALPVLILTRFLGKRSVIHFVTSDIETLLEKRRRIILPLLKLADSVVVGSRHLQKIVAHAGLNARTLTAPVATKDLTHRVRNRLQPRILVVSPLEADANVQAAIRAFRLVKQKYPRAELLVIGRGALRRDLEDLVDRSNIVGVEFRGEVGEAGIGRAMEECDLFLHAPLADESPTVLIKAFAAGLPVVTSDADGLLHMVRDRVSALIVPIGDHVGLADAILELVENEELCVRLSLQGRVEAEKYSWSRVRQDWANLYNTMRSTS